MHYNSERYTVDLRERSYRTILSIFTIYVYLNLLNRYFYPPSILHQIVKKLIKCTWKKEPYRVPVINHLIIVNFFSLFGGWGGGGVVSCLFFILLRMLLTLCRWFCYDETWATLIARTARTEVRFQRSLVIKFHIIKKEWTFPFYIRWQAIIRINCKISVNINHKKKILWCFILAIWR